MKNTYLMLNGQQITFTPEQIEKIKAIMCEGQKKLGEVEEGQTFKIGNYEFIVLEHLNGKTAILLKDLYCDDVQFGANNNYCGSNAESLCAEFAEDIARTIGADNIIEHNVDLTASNGMKCYGFVENAKASLLTLEKLQKYSDIISRYSLEKWWWLATASGTARWGSSSFVLCVSPLGFIDNYNYVGINGVRPFCILNSNIFVSI